MKGDFVIKIRLITASHKAAEVVLIAESWLARARPDQPLDQTYPSESHDREEEVILIDQAQGVEHCTHFLPIHPLENGKLLNFGDAADSFQGRFADLLPSQTSDEKTRQMGHMLLDAMGVKTIRVPSLRRR